VLVRKRLCLPYGTAARAVAIWKGGKVSSYAVKRIDEMEAIFHGSFRRAGAELGVESFGLQVFDMPPNWDQYPEHDHSQDGQEEVYVVLRGSGEFEIDGERVPVDPERILRIAAGTKRRLLAGPQGIRVLALGGVPGKVYDRPEVFRLGAPDPTAAA
jgi:mannose-6-phosphate isomerase-like protein (cupin superfamily)